MVLSIVVSVAGLGVACMGMKCTTCGGDDKVKKSRIAMAGGIIMLVGGETPFSWFTCPPPPRCITKIFSCHSSVRHRGLRLVHERHRPSFLQPFHSRQFKVSSVLYWLKVEVCSILTGQSAFPVGMSLAPLSSSPGPVPSWVSLGGACWLHRAQDRHQFLLKADILNQQHPPYHSRVMFEPPGLCFN